MTVVHHTVLPGTDLLGDGEVQLLSPQVPDLAGLQTRNFTSHGHHGGVATHVGDVRSTADRKATMMTCS